MLKDCSMCLEGQRRCLYSCANGSARPWSLINNTISVPSSYVAHMTPVDGRTGAILHGQKAGLPRPPGDGPDPGITQPWFAAATSPVQTRQPALSEELSSIRTPLYSASARPKKNRKKTPRNAQNALVLGIPSALMDVVICRQSRAALLQHRMNEVIVDRWCGQWRAVIRWR